MMKISMVLILHVTRRIRTVNLRLHQKQGLKIPSFTQEPDRKLTYVQQVPGYICHVTPGTSLTRTEDRTCH